MRLQLSKRSVLPFLAACLVVIVAAGCRSASTEGVLTAGQKNSFSSGIEFTVPSGWTGDWYKRERDATAANEEYETLFMAPSTDEFEEHLNALAFRSSTVAAPAFESDTESWAAAARAISGSSGPVRFDSPAGPVFGRVVRDKAGGAADGLPFEIEAWIDYGGDQPVLLSCELHELPGGLAAGSDDESIVRGVLEYFGLSR